MDPKQPHIVVRAAGHDQLPAPDGHFRLLPDVYPIIETDELDPVTFQPLTGPDIDNPTRSASSSRAIPTGCSGSFRPTVHFFGSTNGARPSPRHRQARPRHPLARHRRLADFADDRVDRRDDHHASARSVGITSGYIGGAFDAWVQRFVELVLAFPQLPLYLALTTLIPVTAPSNVFIAFVIAVLAALGWAQLSPRGARQDAGTCAHRICAGRHGGRCRRRADHLPAHPAERAQPHHRRGDARDPERSCCSRAFLGFLGFAVKPPLISWGLMLQDTRLVLRDRLLPLDSVAGGLRADSGLRLQRAR